MKLYQSIGPNPRVVLMFLEEKGAAIDRTFVDIMKGAAIGLGSRHGVAISAGPSTSPG